MTRKLRDISDHPSELVDMQFLQRKISAAGEMKSAIKHFIDPYDTENTTTDFEPLVAKMRKAMEGYLNVK